MPEGKVFPSYQTSFDRNNIGFFLSFMIESVGQVDFFLSNSTGSIWKSL